MEDIIKTLPDDKKPIAQAMMGLATAMNEKGFKTPAVVMPTEWKGYKFIPMFDAETAKRAYEDMKFDENSVFVASYPKTGTTWVAEILRLILYGDNDKMLELAKSLPTFLTYLELYKTEKIDLYPYIPLPRKLFTTHLPAELLNLEKIKKTKGKIVYLIRNPKDQAVSWFHFAKNIPEKLGLEGVYSSDWNQFFSDFVQGKQPTHSKPGEWYPDHILGWYKHKDDDNVLFVSYEDLKENPEREVKKLAEFVGVKLSQERVDDIVKMTSFDCMKKNQEAGEYLYTKFHKALGMIRTGQIGSWKSTFTEAQSKKMDQLINEKLGHIDVKFTYE